MKLKLSNIYIAFVILFLSFSIYGQQANNWTYVPYNLDDAIKHLKKSIHPAVQKEWIAKSQEELGNNTNFESLEIYISEKWLTPNSKLLSYMEINSKRNNAHTKNILLAFHHYLNDPDVNLQKFLTTDALTSKFVPPIFDSYSKMNLAKFLLQGYNVYNFPICDDDNPITFNYIEKNKKIQLVTKSYEIIPNMIVDGIDNTENNGFCDFIKIQVGNKLGLINNKGKLLLPVEFDCLSRLEKNEFITRKEETWFRYKFDESNSFNKVDFSEGVRDYFYKTIPISQENFIFCPCFSVDNLNSESIPQDDKKAFVEIKSGEELFEPSSDLSFSRLGDEQFVAIFRKNNKKGIINVKTKEILIPFEYDNFWKDGYYTEEKYIIAKKGNKWGIISDKNQLLIPFNYDAIDGVQPSLTLKKEVVFCLQNNKWGLVDWSGNVIIPFMYDGYYKYIYRDKENEYVIFKQNIPKEKHGAVDYSNKVIAPFIFDSADAVKIYIKNENQKNK